jgi:hypothetical protein
MNFKPNEFFIGLLDFFAVLVPGLIFTFLFEKQISACLPGTIVISDSLPFWIAAFIIAYIVGQFIYGISALLDDLIYAPLRPLIFPESKDHAYKAADKIRLSIFETGKAPIQTFKWCKAIVEIEVPEIAMNISKLEAEQKFFRSFFVVSFTYFFYLIFSNENQNSNCIIWGILGFASLVYYFQRRFKCTKTVCEALITLVTLNKLNLKNFQTPEN